MSESQSELIGQTIDGRYRVRKLLGRGGMGEVFEADHVGLGKRVAIKFVTSDNTNKQALARFRREARVASRISHDHVIDIYDVGRAGERDYIVMEFVEGKDLRETLLADGRFAPARAVTIAAQILDGLTGCHGAGILHRDIKPANVLLVARGKQRDFVKIMDFGISKAMADDDEHGETLTGEGNVIGTPDYLAPELLRGKQGDLRIDLYATGMTLWQMLVGKTPFDKMEFQQVVALQLSSEPERVDNIRSDVSPALADVIAKALASDPKRRYQDAAAFREALLALDESASASDEVIPLGTADLARPTEEDAPRGRPLWVYAVVLLGVLVAGGIALALYLTKDFVDVKPPLAIDAAVIDAGVDATDAPVDAAVDAAIDAPIDAVDAAPDAACLGKDFAGRVVTVPCP